MTDDKFKYQYNGLKWLYEMELLDDPQLLNNLKLNIFSVSDHIKEVEFLMSQEQRKILIWIDVSWWGRTFKLDRIKSDVVDILSQLLPNYKFRIVTDRSILELAIGKVKKSLEGGTYAVSGNFNDTLKSDDQPRQEDKLQESSDLLSNKEKHPTDR